MDLIYRDNIARLIEATPFEIDINVQLKACAPTLANSMFLTNKEQGDWAEEIVFNAINEYSAEYSAVRYGRSDSPAAGDPGFAEFFTSYIDELNDIGKKPDLLVYRRSDIPDNDDFDLNEDEFVQKAIAAIEVRSSSFLANRYSSFMENRTREAESNCDRIRMELLAEPYASLLAEKSP